MTEQWVKSTGYILLVDISLSAVYYNWHSLKDVHQETMFTKEAMPNSSFSSQAIRKSSLGYIPFTEKKE